MKFICLSFLLFLSAILCDAQHSADNTRLIEYYQSQRYADALNYLKGVYQEPVTDVRALSQLAYSALMSGSSNDADLYYQRIFNQDSTNKAALYNLASINLRRGNMMKASHYFKQMVAADTTNFAAYKQLARLSLLQNDVPDYIINLQRANKLNAADPDVASDLSDMYVTLKQLPAAEKVLNAAITVDSSDAILLESLIKLTYAQKKWKETLKACNQMVQLGDHSGKVLTKMGEAYYQLKNYSCGVETLAGIDDNQQTETSYYFAAMCYKKLNDKPAAINYLQKAISEGISSSVTTYYGELGNIYDSGKQYNKALAAYQRGLTFNAEPLMYYSLAGLYDEMKDKTNAVKYYKKYLAAKPAADQVAYVNYTRSRLTQLRN